MTDFQKKLVRLTPYAAACFFVFYLGGILGATVAKDNLSFASTFLLFYNPVAVIATGAMVGWKHGFSFMYAPLVGLLFLPALFLFYNYTALPFAVIYMVLPLVVMPLFRYMKKIKDEKRGL